MQRDLVVVILYDSIYNQHKIVKMYESPKDILHTLWDPTIHSCTQKRPGIGP